MFDDKFERLSDEAMSLRITEKFLIEVERSLLRDSQQIFDVAAVKEHLKYLNPSSGNENEAGRDNAESALKIEFAIWRSRLIQRDSAIETFHVRRFCDSARMSLNPKIFQSLTRFYRGIPLNANSQSKFDLMTTRAFASECRGRVRPAQYDREDTCEQLRLLYLDWNETQVGLFCDQEKVEAAVEGFEEFLNEANRLSEFEGLIDSDIFDRIRGFKRDIGTDIFAPECVAAAIECNVTVGRVFDSLMVVANSNLNQRLGEKIDFAGALLDGSLEGGALIDLFAGLTNEPVAAFAGNSDMALLRSMLKRTEAIHAAPEHVENVSESKADEDAAIETANPSVKQRIAAELAAISQSNPDTTLLRSYMSRSSALNVLDLNDFLLNAKGEPDVLGRRALASILCLEEFRDNELASNKALEPEVNDELVAMLDFAERIGVELTEALRVAEPAAQNRLLVVINSLLNSRLQVERAVVRFTVPVEEPAEEIKIDNPPKEEFKPFKLSESPVRGANRWLMAVTVFVVLVCGSMLIFGGANYNSALLPEDVEEVNISKMPGPEHLEQAFRKGNTLFVTAKQSWRGLREKDKRKYLQQMVELELRKTLNVVVVVGPDGQPFGDISAVGATLYGADSMPEANKAN